MATKKQTKADKAFIEKISTIQIGSKSSKPSEEANSCQKFGMPMQKIGHMKGNINGKDVESDVYGHALPPELVRQIASDAKRKASPDEISFSA